MPNGYSVVPNVLPGNVTIGGNLTVSGDQIRIGAASPFTRLGKDSFGNPVYSFNLAFDEATLDNAANVGLGLLLPVGNGGALLSKVNTAGHAQSVALAHPILTDYTRHTHTGDTAEDTIYSKLIRGGTIGSNGGLLVRLAYQPSVQGGVATTVRYKFGGTAMASESFTAASNGRVMTVQISNRNAQNNQTITQWLNVDGAAPAVLVSTGGIDTSADITFSITAQNGANTDSQNFEWCHVMLLNSFGPV